MTDDNTTDDTTIIDEQDTFVAPDELTVLKSKAKLLGITHSPNIKVETLRDKIKAKLDGEPEGETVSDEEEDQEPAVQRMGLREYMRQSQMKLVRLKITNLDPKKADLKGELLTFSNKWVGTVTKYIHFTEEDEAWHVPYCIYTLLQDRVFLQIKTTKNRRGEEEQTQKYVKEYALEVLPPLTAKELAAIKQGQTADGGA